MAQMNEFWLNQFRGGLITNVSNDALQDEEFPLLENVDFDNRGALVRRLGYSDITPTVESLQKKYPTLTQQEIESRFNEQNFIGNQQGYFRLISKPYTITGTPTFDLVPIFNSNDPIGNYSIASNTENVNQETYRAFDGDENTFWSGDDLTTLGLEGARLGVCIKNPKGRRLFKYKIKNNGNKRTMTFTIYGSKDCLGTDLEFGGIVDVQTVEFEANETKEFTLEQPTPRLRAFVLNITSSSDDEYGISLFELGLEVISTNALYDFGNHSLPLFDANTTEVRLSAVEGGIYISNLRTGSDTFEYEGKALPQNSIPSWTKRQVSTRASAPDEIFESIVSNEKLRIYTSGTGNMPELTYEIYRPIESLQLIADFNLAIVLTGGSYSPKGPVIQMQSFGFNLNEEIIRGYKGVDNNDTDFHNYRYEIDTGLGTYEFFFDGTSIGTYPLDGTNSTLEDTRIRFGNFNDLGGPAQIIMDTEWKECKFNIIGDVELNQFESDKIYPIFEEHDIVQFQPFSVIEAKQLENELFVTTGTKIISIRTVIDDLGDTYIVAQNMDKYAYVPNTKEFLFGGQNILNSDKSDIALDTPGSTSSFSVDFFRTLPTRGYVEEDLTIKAYVTTAATKDITNYEFKWEYKLSSEDTFTLGRDYTSGDAGRVYTFNTDNSDEYDFKCIMKEIQVPSPTPEKILTNYKITEVNENTPTSVAEEINECLKIETYYGKLIAYKNGTTNIYKSFGGKPNWFAVSGVIPFNNLRQEPLQKVIPLRNSLLGFTENTTIGLIGKGDDIQYDGRPYEPFTQFITYNANIGCLAPESVAITNDDKAVFLSNRGLHYIDTLAVDQGRADVIKIDDKINNAVLRDRDASGVVYDNKYYICYPRKNFIIKWHYVFGGIFSIDRSSELNFNAMYVYDDEMFGVNQKSKTMQQQIIPFTEDPTDLLGVSDQGYFVDDGEIYTMLIESKSYSFDYERYLKRIMRFIIAFTNVRDLNIELFVDVFADDSRVVSSDTSFYSIEDINGTRTATYTEQESPNAIGDRPAILGEWILARDSLGEFEDTYRFYDIKKTPECYKVKVIIRNEQDALVRVSGFGFSYIIGYIPRELTGRLF